MAFFPCIYFTGSVNPCYFRTDNINYKNLTTKERFCTILKRADKRNRFYKLLYMLFGICATNGFRLVVENPYSSQHYLHNNFLFEPTIIDRNRTMRGDYFVKPTGFWFYNCEPTNGKTIQKDKKVVNVRDARPAKQAGMCSEERSMISPDYARNFICDFIIGKPQNNTQLNLFD